MLRTELYYVNGELDYENENRKVPEIIFEDDSLFFDVENRMKVLYIYPDEGLPLAGMHIWKLSNDSCYDYGFIPRSTDSVYVFHFSRTQFYSRDTIFLRDVVNAEDINLSKEEFEKLKRVNPNYYLVKQISKMLILKQAMVYKK
jgi:hypothetical protein